MEEPMDKDAPAEKKAATEKKAAPATKAAPDKRSPVDTKAAFEQFKKCAVEVLQVPAEDVTPDASFADDLDADSLDLVELVMALEEQFKITVDESELEGVETVGQAFELVTSKL